MQDRLTELFQLHFSKAGNPEQEREFMEMVGSGKHEQQLQELFEALYQEYPESDSLSADQYYPAGARERMLGQIFQQESENTPSPLPIKISIWKHSGFRIAVAAVLSCIAFGIWFYNYRSENKTVDINQELAQDVAPGKQGATLTLANGKTIRLSEAANGKLAEQSGVEISKSADGQLVYQATGKGDGEQINTISTSNGETYILVLPDGSKAWLNSASSLTYSASLVKNGKRSVKLTGEGYFEIAKNKSQPFIVETDRQNIEVLGTHFNVNAYSNEPLAATTLIEGSVKVTAGTTNQVIKPGEQALSEGEKISVRKANLENITDWKDGDFNLDGIDFEVAMRKIARWYDVEIVYEDNIQKHLETGGWIARDKQLSVVLKAIEELGIARFRVDGRKVYAKKYESK